MAKPKPGGRRPRKRERKNVTNGAAHIKSTFNNTIVSITDSEGNVLSWASAGLDTGKSALATSTIFVLVNQMMGSSCLTGSKPRSLKSVGLMVSGPPEPTTSV